METINRIGPVGSSREQSVIPPGNPPHRDGEGQSVIPDRNIYTCSIYFYRVNDWLDPVIDCPVARCSREKIKNTNDWVGQRVEASEQTGTMPIPILAAETPCRKYRHMLGHLCKYTAGVKMGKPGRRQSSSNTTRQDGQPTPHHTTWNHYRFSPIAIPNACYPAPGQSQWGGG